MKVQAIYENGVFRPTEQVDLPDHARVEFEPMLLGPASDSPATLDDLYAILSRSYETGDPYLSERHNEHQT